METDSLFYNLFKKLPRTLFDLLHLPAARARAYRFDSVELKKSLRIDGMFLPKSNALPLYFLEVQYQRTATFYANLFAKVFCYLEENDPTQDWQAVALFENRRAEPTDLDSYRVLLESRHVHRIYLDEVPIPPNPPIGIGILQLLTAPEANLKPLVQELSTGKPLPVIELIDELLIRRFPGYELEELRNMFQLTELRKTKAWQQVHQEGIEVGEHRKEAEIVRRCLAQGRSAQEVADFLGVPLKEVRRLAKETKA